MEQMFSEQTGYYKSRCTQWAWVFVVLRNNPGLILSRTQFQCVCRHWLVPNTWNAWDFMGTSVICKHGVGRMPPSVLLYTAFGNVLQKDIVHIDVYSEPLEYKTDFWTPQQFHFAIMHTVYDKPGRRSTARRDNNHILSPQPGQWPQKLGNLQGLPLTIRFWSEILAELKKACWVRVVA